MCLLANHSMAQHSSAASSAETFAFVPIHLLKVDSLQTFELKADQFSGEASGSVLLWPKRCSPMQHGFCHLFGRKMSIVFWEGSAWFIGVQIAKLLQRETYNMYRSMKNHGIEIQRPEPEHVSFLKRVGVVRGGTHSVTLVPYEKSFPFITLHWREDSMSRKRKSVEPNDKAELPVTKQVCTKSSREALSKPSSFLSLLLQDGDASEPVKLDHTALGDSNNHEASSLRTLVDFDHRSNHVKDSNHRSKPTLLPIKNLLILCAQDREAGYLPLQNFGSPTPPRFPLELSRKPASP